MFRRTPSRLSGLLVSTSLSPIRWPIGSRTRRPGRSADNDSDLGYPWRANLVAELQKEIATREAGTGQGQADRHQFERRHQSRADAAEVRRSRRGATHHDVPGQRRASAGNSRRLRQGCSSSRSTRCWSPRRSTSYRSVPLRQAASDWTTGQLGRKGTVRRRAVLRTRSPSMKPSSRESDPNVKTHRRSLRHVDGRGRERDADPALIAAVDADG